MRKGNGAITWLALGAVLIPVISAVAGFLSLRTNAVDVKVEKLRDAEIVRAEELATVKNELKNINEKVGKIDEKMTQMLDVFFPKQNGKR